MMDLLTLEPGAVVGEPPEEHPWVIRHECRRCRVAVAMRFSKAWADAQGVLWAQYECRHGHVDHMTVIRQDWSLLTGECWCCFRSNVPRELVLDAVGRSYLFTCRDCLERSKSDGLRDCPERGLPDGRQARFGDDTA